VFVVVLVDYVETCSDWEFGGNLTFGDYTIKALDKQHK
jgi:uncharacterized protein YegJ (DUF2314 family)